MRTKKLSAVLLLVLLTAVQAAAQAPTLTRGAPEDVGMSPGVLRGAVELYREQVAKGELVGAVLLVARHGKIVLHEAVGWRDRARDLPMEPTTMFRMASNTKPVIATAVGMLVEEDKLDFQDPVRDWMPSWDNHRSAFIRVDHLLSHTSGLRIPTLFLQPLMEPSAEHPDAPNLKLEAARFGEVGAEFPPGTTYAYNNPGFNTLGALIEMASGQLLEDFLRERIYRPLGMRDSYHMEVAGRLDGKLERMGVIYYERDGRGGWKPGWTPGDPPINPFVRASGGMISTAEDYARFLQLYLNGGAYGGTRLLEEETVEEITTPRVTLDSQFGEVFGETTTYGYGWFIDEEGRYYHGGSDGTHAWVDPEYDLIGLVFTQTPAGENPSDRLMDLVRLAVTDLEEEQP